MFENFFSLGSWCGVAAAMSKLGIRNFSGPFDWYFSYEFSSVLHFMETDFEDFLDKKNLICTGKKRFDDIKYKFGYNHEIKTTLEEDYNQIYDKYQRRIAAFLEAIRQKTCFIRNLYSEQEFIYIKNNTAYIESVIKKQNNQNEIIYVIDWDVNDQLRHPFYAVSQRSSKTREIMRGFFDANAEMKSYCTEHFDVNRRYKNMVFDLMSEEQRMKSEKPVVEKVRDKYRDMYSFLLRLDRADMKLIPIPRQIIIYGAGLIGKFFYHKVKMVCEVLFFVDRKPQETCYDGCPVISREKFFALGGQVMHQ